MRRYLGVVVGIIAFVVGAVIVYGKYKTKTIEAERTLDAERIRSAYLERVGWIRSIPDEKVYKDEVGTFFRWYFNEVNEHLNRFRGNREFDDYLTELEQRKKSGGRDAQAGEKKASYDYAKALFDQMRTGRYQPIFSGTDKGMRLDVASGDVKRTGNKAQISLPVVLWGAQRELREDAKVQKMVTSVSFGVNWKLIDAKGKLYGEMTVNGDPAGKIDWPERFIREFPPQMVLGHFDMDLLPAEVAKIEMTFNISSRAPSGGDAVANYVWKLDAPAEWKLKAGEKWEGAEESVRPEEEIDPSLAAKKGQAHK